MTLLSDYLQNMALQNANTAKVAGHFLADFKEFVDSKYKITLDEHVKNIKAGSDVYETLRTYVQFLVSTKLETKKNSPITVVQKIKAAKRFLEYSDIDISQTKFRLKVKMPKAVKREKTALTKEIIRDVLNACDDIRLKTFVLWLASTGWRSSESMSLRLKDFDMTKSPVVVRISGEFTKTKSDRHTWLTSEMEKQLKEWIAFKYRARTNVIFDKRTLKWQHVKLRPIQRPTDLVFLPYHTRAEIHDNPRTLEYAYRNLERTFLQLVKRLGYGKGSNGKHGAITFHSFRRHVYTTIDGLGLNQFAEFFIGHGTSEYWNKPEAEKVATFRRIEPYLTYLDVSQLEATSADMEAQLMAKDSEILQLKAKMSDLEKKGQAVVDGYFEKGEELQRANELARCAIKTSERLAERLEAVQDRVKKLEKERARQ
jgi:integrase